VLISTTLPLLGCYPFLFLVVFCALIKMPQTNKQTKNQQEATIRIKLKAIRKRKVVMEA